MNRTRMISLLIGVVVTLGGLSAAAGWSSSEARWEYAELLVSAQQCFLVTADNIETINGPANPERGGSFARTERGQIERRTSIKLTLLNRLGNEGWELVSNHPVAEGDVYLLRRTSR